MPDVLVVCPQERDRELVAAAELGDRYRVSFEGDDLDASPSFDVASLIERLDGEPADGVVGTKDRSALVAALVARRRGLPGPDPMAIVRCQHKPTSRELQRAVAPEATPGPPRRPPFFVKPVVGRLSQNARRIDDVSELSALPHDDPYAEQWAELARLAGFRGGVRGFLREELVAGDEVTLEGYVSAGRVTAIGITDSLKYPGTNSFERFEYPSFLSGERQEELADVAARVVSAHGFDGGFFNVEFVVPEDGAAKIVELNGRIASQFAPLMQLLHGRSTYDALFALACGDDPAWYAQPPDGVAVSYVRRVFQDAEVVSVPNPEPGVEILVRPGRRLSEQGANDAFSYRLAIVYGAAETRDEAVRHCRERAQALPFELR